MSSAVVMTNTNLSSSTTTTRTTVAVASRGAGRRTAAAAAAAFKRRGTISVPFFRRGFSSSSSWSSSRRSSSAVVVRASSSSEDDDEADEEQAGFMGSRDWDGNDGPFIRPEGSPFFASYTDPTVWRLMQETLRAGDVEQILPAKAKLMAENDGWTLIDVRPYPDYCEKHAWSAKNAQLYVPMEVDNLAKVAKAAATVALFPERLGKKYVNVECNEYFLEEMQEEVEWGDKVILYCGTGGVIGTEEQEYADGLQTASLIAAHELAARGWGCENIKHMAGGFEFWENVDGFDVGVIEDEDEE